MPLTDLIFSLLTGGYDLIDKWGYLSVFLVSLISSASILFPIPNFILIFSLGSSLNPFLIAIIAALGSTIGETTGYLLGLGGKEILEDKYSRQLKRIKKMFKKYGSVIWIFILGATPLPDDIAGIFCGVIRYDFKKYFIATFLGKLVLYLFLAYSGYYSIGWIINYFQLG